MSDKLEHVLHDNGIHEFIFLDTGRAVVDDYVNQLEALITEMITDDSSTKLRFMLNLTTARDLPAFSYITKCCCNFIPINGGFIKLVSHFC